jgi:hypothetical protein
MFSLPAVALTLGRRNWPLLKETYETLANDMQWKVIMTLLCFLSLAWAKICSVSRGALLS